MAVEVKVIIELNGVDRKLIKLALKTENMDTPLRQSAIYMEGAVAKRFRSGGGSRPWKPLSPNTIKRHPHRAGGKPLNDTGRLRSSVTAGSTRRIVGKRMYYGMGSNIVYAASHNFGYKKIPKREFMYFDEKDEKAIKRVFEDYIKGLIS